MIDHSNLTHNLRGRSTIDSCTQWPVSGRDPVTSLDYTSVSMSMFAGAAIRAFADRRGYLIMSLSRITTWPT